MSRLHRFYVGDELKLKQDFWVHDEAFLWQWNKVLRYRPGQQVILFDGLQTDRLYEITKLEKTQAHLRMITEMDRKLPRRHVYLFWALLKNDHNDMVLEKATELGVSNLIPLLTERTIRTNFNHERAMRIVTEASEQCGRSNIPQVREPVHLEKVLAEYVGHMPLYICQQGSGETTNELPEKLGVLVGPEGGWTDAEQALFSEAQLEHISLGDFTLRAETAAITAVAKVV